MESFAATPPGFVLPNAFANIPPPPKHTYLFINDPYLGFNTNEYLQSMTSEKEEFSTISLSFYPLNLSKAIR